MHRARGRGAATIAATLVLGFGAAACGDEETAPGAPEGVPAAGEFTPQTTPGVPEGAVYDIDGRKWLKLGIRERFEVALAYIDDNTPGRCSDAVIADVVGYVTESLGFDFPPDVPVSEILGEACDASRQS